MSELTSKWNIRLANLADAQAILQIYNPIVTSSAITFELTCPSVNEMEQRISTSFNKHLWLVCECEQQVVGYAYASEFRKRPAYRWITEVSVYVNHQFQRRGVANALYKVLHQTLILQGYQRSMAVMTSPNLASEAFHERAGYQHDVTWKNMGYKFERWHDIKIMSKQLKPIQHEMSEIRPVNELPKAKLTGFFRNVLPLLR